MKSNFVHLHVHSEYSSDGACRIRDLVWRARKLGQCAVALTDHGVLYGAIEFYREAKRAGVKPIIGCEVYVATQIRHDEQDDREPLPAHLTLLCENNEGYHNLLKLVSESWTSGVDQYPRVDKGLLEKYHGGLIALSGCRDGEIPRALLAGDYEWSKETALYYENVFGKENFYLELQDHGTPMENRVATRLIRLADETGIPLVCTNDVHYIAKEDADAQKVLACLEEKAYPENLRDFGTSQFYLKSNNEMRALFPECQAAFDNTMKIAERCNVEFEFGKCHLPIDDALDCNSSALFESLCRDELCRRYGESPDAAVTERLEHEMEVIQDMGYADTFLILWDAVHWTKANDIPVGPGRGNLPGSLCAYCLGITELDPIKYDLLFDRFLNREADMTPAFDIDVGHDAQQKVIDYLIQKYGAERVAQSIKFGSMSAQAAVLWSAMYVIDIPYDEAEKIADLVPTGWNMTIERALEESAELRAWIEQEPRRKELIETAKKLEGMTHFQSLSASGVIISPTPISDYAPLCIVGGQVTAQYSVPDLEKIGLQEMNILGMRCLSEIAEAERIIRRTKPDFRIANIPLDVPEVYQMLSDGETDGIFQMGYQRNDPDINQILKELQPDCFEHLIALTAMYRPGSIDSIPDYIENRWHPENVKYATPQLESILDITYGGIIYQEQLMQIFEKFAGYSFSRADSARRTLAKKDTSSRNGMCLYTV